MWGQPRRLHMFSIERDEIFMIEIGKIQKLEIIKHSDYGVYLGSEAEQVLLPKKEVPKGANKGDILEVFICRDSQERLIATMERPIAQVDETAVLTVKEVTKYGAFLDWGLGKDLFLPYKEQTVKVMQGDRVLVGIYVDKSRRLCATMKVYNYLKCTEAYKEEDVVTGIIYNYNPQYGAFVAVDNQYHGMIPEKELTIFPKVGMQIEARVKSVRLDGKLDLALRKKAYLQIDEDAEKIYRFLEEHEGKLGYADKAAPEVIKRDFQMSKNEFKRAVGRLLKEKSIIIADNKIQINKK